MPNTNDKRSPTIWTNAITAQTERKPDLRDQYTRRTTSGIAANERLPMRKIREIPVGRESTGVTGEKERRWRTRRLRNPSARRTCVQEGRLPSGPRILRKYSFVLGGSSVFAMV